MDVAIHEVSAPMRDINGEFSLYFSLFQGIPGRDRLAQDWLHRQRHE